LTKPDQRIRIPPEKSPATSAHFAPNIEPIRRYLTAYFETASRL
jgi:hypothetical protein